jgi:hypothetical protein
MYNTELEPPQDYLFLDSYLAIQAPGSP